MPSSTFLFVLGFVKWTTSSRATCADDPRPMLSVLHQFVDQQLGAMDYVPQGLNPGEKAIFRCGSLNNNARITVAPNSIRAQTDRVVSTAGTGKTEAFAPFCAESARWSKEARHGEDGAAVTCSLPLEAAFSAEPYWAAQSGIRSVGWFEAWNDDSEGTKYLKKCCGVTKAQDVSLTKNAQSSIPVKKFHTVMFFCIYEWQGFVF